MPSEPLEQTNEQLAVALETLAETMGNVGAELPFLFRLAAERLREPAHNIASLAIAYAEAHDAARAAGDAWRADVGNSDLWSRVRLTESALRTAARALLGNVRLRGATDVEVRAENARLAIVMWNLALRAWCRLRGFHDDGYLRMRPDWSHEWQCWTCRRVRVHLS